MARKKVDLELPKATILWRLHQAAAQNEMIEFTANRLSREINFSVQIITLCLAALEAKRLCKSRVVKVWDGHPQTGEEYVEDVTYVDITRGGISEVEKWSDEYHDDVVRKIDVSRPVSELEALLSGQSDTSDESEVPASDRIVTIKDNAAAHRKAVKAVEDFAKKAAESNEFPALFDNPGDSNVALDEINAGIVLIKKARVRFQVIKELIVKHLELVRDRMGSAMLGEVASRTLGLILKLFGFG